MSAFAPDWALDGGTAKLIERLKDPAARRRIRQEMSHRAARGTTSGRRSPDPEAMLIGVVQNPRSRSSGKDPRRGRQGYGRPTHRRPLDLLVEDQAYTNVAMFSMSEQDIGVAISSRGYRSTTTRREHRPTVLSARSIPIPGPTGPSRGSFGSTCARSGADAGRGDPEIHVAAREPHATRRPRSTQGGHVGRRRGLRSRQRPRQGDICQAEPARVGMRGCW